MVGNRGDPKNLPKCGGSEKLLSASNSRSVDVLLSILALIYTLWTNILPSETYANFLIFS